MGLPGKILRLVKANSAAALKYVANNLDFTYLLNEYYFKNKYPLKDNETGIICCWGIGDTVMVAGLIHAVVKQHAGINIVMLVKPGHRFIAESFPSVSKVYVLDAAIDYLDRTINTIKLPHQQLIPGKYFYAHFQNWELSEMLGHKGITMLDLYIALFKLPKDTKLEQPVLVSKDQAAVEALFKQYGIKPGKTILLAPEANSIKTIAPYFWKKLAGSLLEMGYSVVINSNPDLYSIENAIYINLELEQVVPFALLAGYTIAVRSGLCDLLSVYNANMTVIYPKMQWYYGSLMEGAGILKMWNPENLVEIEIAVSEDNNNLEQVYEPYIGEIISSVVGK